MQNFILIDLNKNIIILITVRGTVEEYTRNPLHHLRSYILHTFDVWDIGETFRIPINWCAREFHVFDCEMTTDFTFDNNHIYEAIQILNEKIHVFIDERRQTHAFDGPHLVFRPGEKKIYAKIATMEIEEYNRRLDNKVPAII